MAEKHVVKAARQRGTPSIDLAMSALAAFSVGFAAFAMPADLFRSIAGAMPRLPVIGGAAVLTFIAILALLRALDRLPSGRRPAEVPAEPPRLRRADAHPDAPPRWPIFARHELGTPLPVEQPEVGEVDVSEEQPVSAPEPVAEEAAIDEVLELDSPLTGLLASDVEISEGEPVERPEPSQAEQPLPSFIAPEVAEETAPVAEDVVAVEAPAVADIDDAAPVAEELAETEIDAEPVIEPVPAEEEPVLAEEEGIEPLHEEPAPVAEELAPAVEEEFAAASLEEPFPAQEEEPVAEVEEQPRQIEELISPPEVAEPAEALAAEVHDEPAPPESVVEEPIEALAARIPELPEARDEPIADLIGRLEVGLGRSDRARWLGQEEGARVEAPPADERLRGAIGKLRRMAGRKG